MCLNRLQYTGWSSHQMLLGQPIVVSPMPSCWHQVLFGLLYCYWMYDEDKYTYHCSKNSC